MLEQNLFKKAPCCIGHCYDPNNESISSEYKIPHVTFLIKKTNQQELTFHNVKSLLHKTGTNISLMMSVCLNRSSIRSIDAVSSLQYIFSNLLLSTEVKLVLFWVLASVFLSKILDQINMYFILKWRCPVSGCWHVFPVRAPLLTNELTRAQITPRDILGRLQNIL